MKKLYSIGEVSKLKGITIRTLRFYDEIGLVKPCYTDKLTGYRYYSVEQFLLIENIILLKNAGIPLKELKKVCVEDHPIDLAELCVSYIESAKEKIEQLNQAIGACEQLCTRIYYDKARSVNFELYEKDLPERNVVMYECKTNPTALETYDIYFKMYSEIRSRQLPSIFATGALVLLDLKNCDFLYDKAYVEITSSNLPKEEIFAKIPGGKYLCVNYFEHNKQEQLEKICKKLRGKSIELVIEAATFYTVTNYNNPLLELQVLYRQ